jgi:hypothetical protein
VLVPIETMIDGVVRTLTERVLPDVPTRFARGQLYAVIDVLRNLRDRVEPRASLFEDESTSIAAALARVAPLLSAASKRTLDAAVAEVPPAPAAARLAALRSALLMALDALDDLAPADAAEARAAIAEHLVAQTMRDLAVLKPSLVGEISKG